MKYKSIFIYIVVLWPLLQDRSQHLTNPSITMLTPKSVPRLPPPHLYTEGTKNIYTYFRKYEAIISTLLMVLSLLCRLA